MLEFLIEYRATAQQIVSVLLALAMLRWGGAPERWLALIFVGLFTVPTVTFEQLLGYSPYFLSGGAYFVVVDVLASVAFVMIALNANRTYPLWIAGFQLVALSAHGVRFLIEAISPIAYAMLVIGPSYFQLAIMAAGLVRHVRRENRFGSYRDWRIARKPIDFDALARSPGLRTSSGDRTVTQDSKR